MAIPTFDAFLQPFLALLASDGVFRLCELRSGLEANGGFIPMEFCQRLPPDQFTACERLLSEAAKRKELQAGG